MDESSSNNYFFACLTSDMDLASATENNKNSRPLKQKEEMFTRTFDFGA